jgi:hypothetical protein
VCKESNPSARACRLQFNAGTESMTKSVAGGAPEKGQFPAEDWLGIGGGTKNLRSLYGSARFMPSPRWASPSRRVCGACRSPNHWRT